MPGEPHSLEKRRRALFFSHKISQQHNNKSQVQQSCEAPKEATLVAHLKFYASQQL